MPDINYVTAVGRLLTSENLRQSFANNPQSLALEMGVKEADCACFISMDTHQLEAQAKTLVSKRFHEVRKLLPETCRGLGDRGYRCFVDFSEQYWPHSHRRHLLDAQAFIAYLKNNGIEFCQSEYNRLLFASNRKKLSINILTRVKTGGRIRAAIQVICKISSKQYECCFYLVV